MTISLWTIAASVISTIFFIIGIYALILFIIFAHKGIKAFNIYIKKNQQD